MAMYGVPQGVLTPPKPAPSEDAAGPDHGIGGKTPGTLLLVFVFLLAFVLYYFVNWKLLSFVWRIG
jgi:cytochrome c oxidase subunit I